MDLDIIAYKLIYNSNIGQWAAPPQELRFDLLKGTLMHLREDRLVLFPHQTSIYLQG